MVGIGTLINVGAIIVGGLIGIIFKKLFTEKLQDSLTKAIGLSVIFLGIGGTVSKMLYINNGALDIQGSLMLIGSFVIGTCIGELIDINMQFERFGEWLRKKTGNKEDNSFVNAFVITSFTVCIGAMAIVGSLQDGLQGDPSILIAKSILDFTFVAVMTSTMGKGCIFSAIPVALIQWPITFLSGLLTPIMTERALDNISYIGSILIFCVGANMIGKPRFKVANMLPAIIVAVVFGFFQ